MKTLFRFAALGLTFLLTACSEAPNPDASESALRYVRTIQLDTAQHNSTIELPGVVAANREAELSFRISGKVDRLLVKEGEAIQQGQLLAALDETDIQIRLKSDQAQYDRALADFRRGQALVGNGTISQADYNQLESNLAGAEATLETTKQNLVYSNLDAPFSGVIAKRNIENFEEVQAKQAVLVIQDVSSINIKVDIPESIMILTDESSQPEVVALFDAVPDKTFPLMFKEIATQANRETSTYEVTMSMPRVEGYNILPGMSVTARATRKAPASEASESSIYVPTHAVLEDSNGRHAFIVSAKTDNTGSVERRNVVTGNLNSFGLEIVSGLSAGDRLIVAGMSKMYDGLEVKLDKE